MWALSKTWAADLVTVKQATHEGNAVTAKTESVPLWFFYTRVRHVFELWASSDHQENQVEDVEDHYNQEEHLHALENTGLA